MSEDVKEWLNKQDTTKNRPKNLRRKPKSSKKPSVESKAKKSDIPKSVPAQVAAPIPSIEEIEERRDIIFKPNPGPQTSFLAASEQEVLYGGAAGGGKSYALLADPLRDMGNPYFSGILFRRTNDELRELKAKSKELYPRVFGKGTKWSERESQWTMPSGATLWMTYLDREDDVLRYQGQAFNYIGFDELTQWATPYSWNYMRSRLRTSKDTGLKLYQRATSNPGGPGHQWVKGMFIDPAAYNTPFWATNPDTGEKLMFPPNHARAGEPLFQRKFIPANLFDNPYLTADGLYEANLLSLPEHQRRQLLEGDWDVAEGAAFSEFKRSIHVIDPFEIPKSWKRFRACDYGYSSHTAVIWFAVEPKTEKLIIYRELYVSKVTAVDLADTIKEIEAREGKVSYGVLDSSLWHKRGDLGPSLAEQMNRKGLNFRPSDRSKGSRVAGKNELHRRLQIDPMTEEPRLQIFSSCVETISQLPTIPLDKRNPEDVDTNYIHDHIYDAIRYGIMTRPRSSLWDYQNTERHVGYRPASSTFGY